MARRSFADCRRSGLALAFTLLLAALVMRAILIGHAPWSNLHEFSLAFAAALIGTHLLLGRAHPLDGLAPFTALLAAGLVAFSLGLDAGVDPLVPALQQPLLLTIHVGAAVLAYAVSGVAFVAAAAEIGQARSGDRIPLLPSAAAARAIGHRAVLVAFPILTHRDRPRIGLGQPGVAVVLEQRPQGAGRGRDLARVRRLPARCRAARSVGAPRPVADRARLRRRAVHVHRRWALLHRRAQLRGAMRPMKTRELTVETGR